MGTSRSLWTAPELFKPADSVTEVVHIAGFGAVVRERQIKGPLEMAAGITADEVYHFSVRQRVRRGLADFRNEHFYLQ